MKLAGVIGDPIGHSKSPKLHRYWLKQNDIIGDYVALPVEKTALEAVLKTLPHMGFMGVNITIPHKIEANHLADHVTDQVAVIGAANTLTFDDGKIYADNTDGLGFLNNLKESVPSWKPENTSAIVLGAGGACRAILSALLDAGVPEITLLNRTREKAEALKQIFGNRIRVEDWSKADPAPHGLIVNTTSLGMRGQPDLDLPFDAFTPGTIVNDLVYNPLETSLLAKAKERGCVPVDGLGMLIHQGAPGFERWFGVKPQVTSELRRIMQE